MNFSPLNINQAPVLSPDTLKSWGKVLAIAPHPDDEALCCGGTLALLAQLRVPTAVLWVSNGAASHPDSKSYAAPKLANLREAEGKMALDKLGVGRKNSFFLRLPDGAVPFPGDAGFERALDETRSILEDFAPRTLLLPWRRDAHRDHRASWQLLSRAAQGLEVQTFEYLVWALAQAEPQNWPQNAEASAFAVDISKVLARKKAAIRAHASQTTRLVRDDPGNFRISADFIAQCENSHEAWIAPFCSLPEIAGRAKPR
jgi:LmbE family N-acetylglucosaminyl deacetylase